MAGLAPGVLNAMDRTLEEKKTFSGTFCCLNKSLRTGDVLTTVTITSPALFRAFATTVLRAR